MVSLLFGTQGGLPIRVPAELRCFWCPLLSSVGECTKSAKATFTVGTHFLGLLCRDQGCSCACDCALLEHKDSFTTNLIGLILLFPLETSNCVHSPLVSFLIFNFNFNLFISYCRGLKAEKIAARQAILPLIQAEEDARFDSYILPLNFDFRIPLKWLDSIEHYGDD